MQLVFEVLEKGPVQSNSSKPNLLITYPQSLSVKLFKTSPLKGSVAIHYSSKILIIKDWALGEQGGKWAFKQKYLGCTYIRGTC